MVSKKVASYLRKIYHDPKRPGSYGGAGALYRAVRAAGKKDITMEDINNFLATDDTYTLHKSSRRHFHKSRVIVRGIDDEYFVDLADMSALKKYNNNCTFILVAVDAFSRYLFTTALKNKSAKEVLSGLEKLMDSSRRPQRSIYSDGGREWDNKLVVNFLKSRGIKLYISMNAETKASFAERAILDIKRVLSRYMTDHETYRYIDVLQQFTDQHNNSFNRVLGMTPLQVTKENEESVWKHLYLSPAERAPVTKTRDDQVQVGDYVRISYRRHPFSRSYHEQWSTELFQVYGIKRRDNLKVFLLRDLNGKEIKGEFYQKEVQKVIITPNKLYKIEKILGTKYKGRRKFHLVRFKHWGPDFDTYIPAKDIKRLK